MKIRKVKAASVISVVVKIFRKCMKKEQRGLAIKIVTKNFYGKEN